MCARAPMARPAAGGGVEPGAGQRRLQHFGRTIQFAVRRRRQNRHHRLDHAAAGRKRSASLPPDADLVYARAAASDVLTHGEKYASAPWENPQSGARGTVTPIASAYTQDGRTCRDFLASYVSGASQSWMQGEACKQDKGRLGSARAQALERRVSSVHPRLRGNERDRAAPARRSPQGEGALHPGRLNPTLSVESAAFARRAGAFHRS